MTLPTYAAKLTPSHLSRKAIVYLRQSSDKQVHNNKESQRLQYALAERARSLGWERVEVIDSDLGSSAAVGARRRTGFENMIASVALGEVGIVLSRELSRLARTESAFCQLMEVCAVFDTRVGDAEQIYDLSLLDDQLVLGIKGTMSVVELKVLNMRMQQGLEEKARRGELQKLLSPGYVYDSSGKMVRDPDQRVQQAVLLVFRKFRETWSIRQSFKWFHEAGVALPVNKARGSGLQIVWQLPSYDVVRGILNNPVYAGAYVYGRRPTEMVLQDGRLQKRSGRLRRAEECRVFLRDHHEGYIDWETYQEHQRMIRRNSFRTDADETVAPARAGQGLLVGLLRCGRCGRKLHVRYRGRKATTGARYLCKGDFASGGSYCQGFGGATVDRRFSQELLKVLSPLGVEASLKAMEELSCAGSDRREALRLQLHQLEYEARRASEQYNEADPRNRLVAAQLERRWNDKLEEVEHVKVALEQCDREAPQLSEGDQERVQRLGESFAQVWESNDCPAELRKQLVRSVLEEAIVNLDEKTQTLTFTLHWKGGTHTQLEMAKPVSGIGRKTSLEDLDVIRRMAARYNDAEITRVLNKLDRRTAKGKRWNQTRVKTARRNHSIPINAPTRDPDILTMGQAARHCGVSQTTIKRLVASGLLKVEQIVAWAPWEIRRSDLDADPVRRIVERLRQTGKLVLAGVDSDAEPTLFQ